MIRLLFTIARHHRAAHAAYPRRRGDRV